MPLESSLSETNNPQVNLHSQPLAPAVLNANIEQILQEKGSQAYSGLSHTGLDREASFDRMIYLDRSKTLSYNQLQTLVTSCLNEFKKSQRSRLVVRVLTTLKPHELDKIQTQFPQMELDTYPDSENSFQYLTMALNKEVRAITPATASQIKHYARQKIQETLQQMGNFEEFALQELNKLNQKGYAFDKNLNTQELHKLWKLFGWDQQACQDYLDNPGQNQILGVRNENGDAIAIALYSDQSHQLTVNPNHPHRHGESTEWSTLPEYRHQGVIVPLLNGLHCMMINRGVHNIYADLRTPDPSQKGPHSISPALKSGMKIYANSQHNFISQNHVTIAGTPDTHNQDRQAISHTINSKELRSFVKGHVSKELLTNKVRDAYLSAISE